MLRKNILSALLIILVSLVLTIALMQRYQAEDKGSVIASHISNQSLDAAKRKFQNIDIAINPDSSSTSGISDSIRVLSDNIYMSDRTTKSDLIDRFEKNDFEETIIDSKDYPQSKEKDLEFRLLEEIRIGSKNLKLTDEAKSLIDELSAKGEDVVSLLFEEYKIPNPLIVLRNTVILEALKEIGSDQAKKVLLELAFYHVPDAGNLGMRAAQTYVAIENDGSKIAQLLESPEDGVSDIASEALVGKTLNLEITKALGKQLNSKTIFAHRYVPAAFAKDSSVFLADEKIGFLLNSFSNLKNMENSDRQAYGSVWTESETAFNNYIQAISKIQGGEQVLRSRIARADSLQREAIIIALALRRLPDVHNDLIKIIESTKDAVKRALAITGIGIIGEKTDISILQKLADTDTFMRKDQYYNDSYPIRDAARQAIKEIEQRYQ